MTATQQRGHTTPRPQLAHIDAVLRELDSIREDIDLFVAKQERGLADTRDKLTQQIHDLRMAVIRGGSGVTFVGGVPVSSPATLPRVQQDNAPPQGLFTPQRQRSNPSGAPMSTGKSLASPPPVNHALSFDALMEDVTTARSAPRASSQQGDLLVDPHTWLMHPAAAAAAGAKACCCLVEFKRQRVNMYESPIAIATGEFVVVGADRGEDIGQVTLSWPASSPPPPGAVKYANTHKTGEKYCVVRVASSLEVAQLQGVQAEMENRARDAAQAKVKDHGLPMQIVDAEYQFDRKKLTFYYQSQHRLDFRNLVKDLYKTFHARIWMEQD